MVAAPYEPLVERFVVDEFAAVQMGEQGAVAQFIGLEALLYPG